MGCMREKYAWGLLGIDKPGNFLFLVDIFFDEFSFIGVASHWVHMTACAFCKGGDTGETAVFSEKVAGVALAAHLFNVDFMVEINGLLLC
jgi:hypothetical protein